MRKFTALLVALLLVPAAIAEAKPGGGSSSGGSRSSSPSSSGKSYGSGGGSKSATSGSSSKVVSASKPSSGPKMAPPITRTLPKAPPTKFTAPTGRTPRVSVPPGRSHTRDYNTVSRNPRYYDPYRPTYYGAFGSPFFYLWAFSIMDDDQSNNPLPAQADGMVAPIMLSYFGVSEAMVAADDEDLAARIDRQTIVTKANLDRLNATLR